MTITTDHRISPYRGLISVGPWAKTFHSPANTSNWCGRSKHEVENEYQQEKTLRFFYSLAEEREKAIQAIQKLRPRTCLVKAPQERVTGIHTIIIPGHSLSDQARARLELALARKEGQPRSRLENEIQKRRA